MIDATGGSALNASVETSKEASRAPQSANRRRGNVNIEILRKNTFAVPRNVKPLGWSANKQETEGDGPSPMTSSGKCSLKTRVCSWRHKFNLVNDNSLYIKRIVNGQFVFLPLSAVAQWN